jgi:hypothetical protein
MLILLMLYTTIKCSLIDWMLAHDNETIIHSHLFKIEQLDSQIGKGLVATQDIQSNTILFELPQSLIIDDEIAIQYFQQELKVSDHVLYELQEMSHKQPTNFMAFFLLTVMENESSSYWKYINSLPIQYPPKLSFMYSQKELQELDGSMLQLFSIKRRDAVEKFYHESIEKNLLNMNELFSKNNISDMELLFKKALAYVWSRTHSVYNNKYNSTRPALVPLGDLINYDVNPNVISYTDKKTNRFVFQTTRSISSGEQILVSYGQQISNYQLMMDYGFCDMSVSNDSSVHELTQVVFIDTSEMIQQQLSQSKYDQNPKLVRGKYELLTSSNLFGYDPLIRLTNIQCDEYEKSKELLSIIDPSMITLLRILNMDESEVYSSLQIPPDQLISKLSSSPVSNHCEDALKQSLKNHIHKILSRYRTTIEQDLDLIWNSSVDNNHEYNSYPLNCIVRVRYQEKRLLNQLSHSI